MPLDARRLWLASALCAIAFAVLALLVFGSGRFSDWDSSLSAHLLAQQGSRLDSVANAMADLANPAPYAVILATLSVVGIYRGDWRLVLAGLLVALAANLTTQLFKVALTHPRFQMALGADHTFEVVFPSGHTTAAAAAGFMAWLALPGHRPLGAAIGLALTCVVGAGVLIAGWHYPSDVAGAILIVASWGLAALALLRHLGLDGGSGRPPDRSSAPGARASPPAR